MCFSTHRLVLCRSLFFQQRAPYRSVIHCSTRPSSQNCRRRCRNSQVVMFFQQQGAQRTTTTTTTTTTTAVSGSAATKAHPPPLPDSLPSPTPNWQVYLVIAQRIAMAWGMIHVVTEYGVDVTLCDGPSMMPTIQPSGEMLLMEKMSTRRCLHILHHQHHDNDDECNDGVQDGDTAAKRIRAARSRQRNHRPTDVWHEPRLLPLLLTQDEATAAAADGPSHSFSWREAWEHVRSPLSVGDVVVSDHPHRPGTICKRLVALPGDQVLLKQTGRLVTVPDGHVWLEGDNVLLSHDSRYYGPIPLALIRGRAIARIWPLRGSAWLHRRRIPSGSTILPAGYQGEHIAYSHAELRHLRGDHDDTRQ